MSFRRASARDWFSKTPVFDARCRERFLSLHEEIAQRHHDDWIETPEGALALLILTDQFPRNAFRGTPRMYAADPLALDHAKAALEAGHMDPDRAGIAAVLLPALRALGKSGRSGCQRRIAS